MAVDGTAVKEIGDYAQRAQYAESKVVRIEGLGTFSSIPLSRIEERKESEPATLKVSTLAAIASYVRENRDKLSAEAITVHVVSPTRVDVVSELTGKYRQRLTFLTAETPSLATAGALGFAFGKWLDTETMIIALLTLFQNSHSRADVMRLLGNMTAEEVATKQDDGFTQKVSVRAGVAMVDRRDVPNPVTLAPFRTFPEVEQPASPFVLRVRKENGIQAVLYEADGGAWRTAATGAVARWLDDALPDEVAVLA